MEPGGQVLVVSDSEAVESLLSAAPGSIGWILTRSPSITDIAGTAARWKVVVIDATERPDAVELGVRLRQVDASVEFIVVARDTGSVVDAVRRGAFEAVCWPCDASELWEPIAACLARVRPGAAPDGLGHYRFVRKLGEGGMAEVFLAESPRFDDPVVVKVMLPSLSELAEFRGMFESEARISAMLSHPNLVSVLDHGTLDGRLFLALEFVEGWDLLAIGKAAEWEFPPAIAFYVAAEIAAGLAYAHARTDVAGLPLFMVHRDVNPPNILVGRNGRVRLADFGIAKSALQATQTAHGVLKGKVEYFSPEQIASEPLDGRSDVFSLGATLHLLLTGTHPFRGPTRLETLKRVRDVALPPASALARALPPETGDVIARALAGHRENRFSSSELEAALRSLAGRAGPAEVAAFAAGVMDEKTRKSRLAATATVTGLTMAGRHEASLGATESLHKETRPTPTPAPELRRQIAVSAIAAVVVAVLTFLLFLVAPIPD